MDSRSIESPGLSSVLPEGRDLSHNFSTHFHLPHAVSHSTVTMTISTINEHHIPSLAPGVGGIRPGIAGISPRTPLALLAVVGRDDVRTGSTTPSAPARENSCPPCACPPIVSVSGVRALGLALPDRVVNCVADARFACRARNRSSVARRRASRA